jgi:hypothetical protein
VARTAAIDSGRSFSTDAGHLKDLSTKIQGGPWMRGIRYADTVSWLLQAGAVILIKPMLLMGYRFAQAAQASDWDLGYESYPHPGCR